MPDLIMNVGYMCFNRFKKVGNLKVCKEISFREDKLLPQASKVFKFIPCIKIGYKTYSVIIPMRQGKMKQYL